MKHYFYHLLHTYLAVYIRPHNSLIEIHPQNPRVIEQFFTNRIAVLRDDEHPAAFASFENLSTFEELASWQPDYILLNGNLHYEQDIQTLLEHLYAACAPATRVLIIFYSSLWKPLAQLATALKLRSHTPEQNWLAIGDVENLLRLAGFEPIRNDQRILLPFQIPIISDLVNRCLAPLPLFRLCTLVNVMLARPLGKRNPPPDSRPPSVSVVVAARNEAGNIEPLFQRLPRMGPDDELVLVEGHSTDNTWTVIQAMARKYAPSITVTITQQDGYGKGDAIRKGLELALKEIVMILDADLTVPPEDLPKFYRALLSDQGEFINGSRLVYPMEAEAMRFWNIVGNKFFATAFSFVLGQRFKDTLCGTKVLTRENYRIIAQHRAYFGDFDPFGDFDLLFGASRLGLKIVEVPIAYKERTYGRTNIHRWRHGVLLLKMLWFAARKIKFI